MSSIVHNGAIPRSRTSDPVTSVEAGRAADLAGSQSMVLELLEDHKECTDYELECDLADHFSPQRVRTARSELVALGLVEDTGKLKLSGRGRRRKHHATIWRRVATE